MQLSDDVFFYPSPAGLDFSKEICANTVVLKGRKLVLIDPGIKDRLSDLMERMASDGLNPVDVEYIILTHSHPDHLEAAPDLAEKFGSRLIISRIEYEFMKDSAKVFFANHQFPGPEVIFELQEEGTLTASGLELKIFLTPGHSPGSISILWPKGKLLLTGDLYFPGTIGAINLYGGNPGAMYKSVSRLRDLGGVEMVLCGHGPAIIDRDMIIQNYRALFAEIAAKKAAGVM
ncbi:MAG: MBL fold metallo-hydrolase [Deltaproteobacteria bacterium]|jgi:glyoxylase-like metal-dependent hydrolase (beta-lactamase superfamily II)|nr:MBL fold metallo-hydrolase [Deltaproteobacteria bacterium]